MREVRSATLISSNAVPGWPGRASPDFSFQNRNVNPPLQIGNQTQGRCPMTTKHVHGRITQRSLLNVEALEDRSVPSTTTLAALGVQEVPLTGELALAPQGAP